VRDLQPGTQLERYTVQALIGQGGMAMVYRVRHDQLGTLHAMKVLTVASHTIRQRLLQEGRVQAALAHPNVVSVTDVVDVDGSPGLVMELVRGPSLERLLSQHRLTYEQTDMLVQGIVRGVSAAHVRGLFHRDLKPANILLSIGPRGLVPKVTDFGLAKILHSESGPGHARTRSGATMGTPAYMAPEQVRDARAVDERADIFSLGTILYEMTTGRRAFESHDTLALLTMVAEGRFAPIHEIAPDTPPRMERAIVGALVVDRDQRIRDCGALLGVWRGETKRDSAPNANAPDPVEPWAESLLAKLAAAPNGPSDDPSWDLDTASTDNTWAARARTATSGERADTATYTGDGPLDGSATTEEALAALIAQTAPESDASAAPSPQTRSQASLKDGAGTPPPMRLRHEAIAPSPAKPLVIVAIAVGLAATAMAVFAAVNPRSAPARQAPPPPTLFTPAPAPEAENPPVPIVPLPVELLPVAEQVATITSAPPPVRPVTPAPVTPAPTPTEPIATLAAPVDPPPIASVPPESLSPDAQIAIAGDASAVWLRSANGNYALPSAVPPGTYQVAAYFGPDQIVVGEITVARQERRTIRCNQALKVCK
jgi:serine/threonine-protein kinase